MSQQNQNQKQKQNPNKSPTPGINISSINISSINESSVNNSSINNSSINNSFVNNSFINNSSAHSRSAKDLRTSSNTNANSDANSFGVTPGVSSNANMQGPQPRRGLEHQDFGRLLVQGLFGVGSEQAAGAGGNLEGGIGADEIETKTEWSERSRKRHCDGAR